MSTSRNRKSTVGWISKGFNAGNKKALDTLVQKEQTRFETQESKSTLKTSSSSSLVTSSEEQPINIIVFDGGGMKGKERRQASMIAFLRPLFCFFLRPLFCF